MYWFELFIKRNPLAICLAVALIFIWISCVNGQIAGDVIPFSDGYHYSVRAFTLYGYLHSGQWFAFCHYFSLPLVDDLAPLNYWLFFLLPKGLANITSYGLILCATTCLLLAFGLYRLCLVLNKPQWTVPLYVVCLAQNAFLDYAYFYYLDGAFFAAASLAMATQLNAWKTDSLKSSLISGALVGLLFWIKPANAVLYMILCVVAELIWAASWLQKAHPTEDILTRFRLIARHWQGFVCGFLPVAGLAMYLGGAHVILLVLYVNEISSGLRTHLECAGLARLFYFPLCLSYFYNLILIALAALILAVTTFSRSATPNRSDNNPEPLKLELLMPLFFAGIFLGELFSFGLETKTVRCLLILLPQVWLLVFWLLEKMHVRLGVLTLVIFTYTACGVSQVLFDTFSPDVQSPESYQLKGDWYAHFPPPSFRNLGAANGTHQLIDNIHQVLPQGGKIVVSTEQFYLNDYSLNWSDGYHSLLRGEHPRYLYTQLVNSAGTFQRSDLKGANAIVLITFPGYISSEISARKTWMTVAYSKLKWEKDGEATIFPLQGKPLSEKSEISIGFLISFKSPLTDPQIEFWAKIVKVSEPELQFNHVRDTFEHQLSWSEACKIISCWYSNDKALLGAGL